jgi:ribose transport system ATP-binding protein
VTQVGAELIRLEQISVRFGQFKALDDVSLAIRRGEVHALVGENGAGKSTLMNVLSGSLKPTSGTVRIDGKDASADKDLTRKSVAMVHQHFQLVESLTVAENMFVAQAGSARGWLVNRKKQEDDAERLLARFGLSGKGAHTVRDLTTAERQLVEIAKATAREAPVLILDEPTASLGEAEADELFALVRRMREKGTAIVLIAHSLEEVLSVADRISVLRGGKLVGTVERQDVDRNQLVKLIVGRDLNESYPCERPRTGASLLEAKKFLTDKSGAALPLELRAGQITGIPTYVGADTEQLLDALFGKRAAPDEITVCGAGQPRAGIARRVQSGVALVPGDALKEGVIPALSITDNIVLPNARKLSRFGILDRKAAKALVGDMTEKLGIRAASPATKAGELSGGNRQKVVLAKWLASGAKVLLMNDPTKAVDVGARLDIYRLMDRSARDGAAVLLVSSDIDEIIGMCDVVHVVHQSALVATHERPFAKQSIMEDVVSSRASRSTH